ncbi:MAG: hypothetical protein HXY41_05780, partial [Chloroflexi bacterium]|nr:hypothetical protein [Chloroflexota bacterium]
MREYGDEYDDLQDDEYYDEFDEDEELDDEEEEEPKKDAGSSSSSRVNPFSGKPSTPDTRASGLPGAGRSSAYDSASRLPGTVGPNRPASSSPPPAGTGSGARPFGSGSSSPPPAGTGSGARPFGSGSSSPPPAGSPPKKDEPDKPASAGSKLLGGLTSRIGGDKGSSDKKDNKSADAFKGSLGRFTSGLGNRGKDAGSSAKPAAPKGDQKGGNLLSKLPFGKSGDKKPASSPPPGSGSSSLYGRPASPPSSGSSSPFGKPASSPPSSSASAPRFGSAASRPVGGAPGAAAKPAAARSGPFGFLQRGKKDDKKAAKPRQSKAPKVEQGAGLTLDNKLDILGVFLVLGSLALFFSSLSTTKGALTEAVNTFLANLLGWGAAAIPLVMLAIGIWLIARHFGDEAPVVERMRIIGLVMLYLGVLIFLQFIDSFSYEGVTNLNQLRVQLELSWTFGRGGGWLGAQVYFLMVSNITEIGAFFVALGWLIVSIMLTADVSFYQLAAFFISAGRSFRDARQHRAQARAAEAAAKALAAQQAPPQISVAAPPPEALPAGAAPALPVTAAPAPGAPALVEAPRPERNIPITIGGRTISAFNSGELTGAEAPTVPVLPPPETKTRPDETARVGGLGGRLGGLRLPLGGKPTEAAAGKPSETLPKPAAAPKEESTSGGGLRGRFFGGKSEAPKAPSPAAPAEVSQPPAASAAPASSPPAAAPAAPSGAVVPPRPDDASRWKRPETPPKAAEEPAARLGDLVRPATPPPPAAAAPKAAEEPAARLGDLVRPATPPPPARAFTAPAESAPVRPFGETRPSEPASKPPFDLTMDDDEDDLDDLDDDEELTESEKLANLPPAQPKGYVEPPRRPDEARSRFGPTVFGAPRPAETTPKPDAESKPEAEKVPPLAERLERLNAIRSGNLNPPKPEDGQAAAPAAKTEPEKPAAAARPEGDKPASPLGSTPRPFGVQPFGSRSPTPDDAEKPKPVVKAAETRPDGGARISPPPAAERPDSGARIAGPPSTPPVAPPRPTPVINPPGAFTEAAAPAPMPVAGARPRR